MKTVKLGEVFDDQDIRKAHGMLHEPRARLVQRLMEEVVQPKMGYINLMAGRENDARYLAYALLNAMSLPHRKHWEKRKALRWTSLRKVRL